MKKAPSDKNLKRLKFMNIMIFYIWKPLLQVCVLCYSLLTNMMANHINSSEMGHLNNELGNVDFKSRLDDLSIAMEFFFFLLKHSTLVVGF